ncbi:hypothetical protein EYF80_000959 [Liparis tanakae]|uniref:Uncharacterized protein n=1 Tax=Liparis tanakae TaxID=230148 RepID=A0A4Z2JF72_9TELE|nr:hypothetical protein EYF80_000959 [Liparis tanakae]
MIDVIPGEADWSPSEGSGSCSFLAWRVLRRRTPRSRKAAGQGLTFPRHTSRLLPTLREFLPFPWVSTHHKWPGSVR